MPLPPDGDVQRAVPQYPSSISSASPPTDQHPVRMYNVWSLCKPRMAQRHDRGVSPEALRHNDIGIERRQCPRQFRTIPKSTRSARRENVNRRRRPSRPGRQRSAHLQHRARAPPRQASAMTARVAGPRRIARQHFGRRSPSGGPLSSQDQPS